MPEKLIVDDESEPLFKPQPRPLFIAIAKVKAKLSAIEKRGVNEHFNYPYLRIGDIYDAIRHAEAEEGIVHIPHIENATRAGDITKLDIAWQLVHGPTGDSELIRMPGEGQDKQDKGTQKALAASHKAVLIPLYEISGEDPEAGSNATPRRTTPPSRPAQPPSTPAPAADKYAKPQPQASGSICGVVRVVKQSPKCTDITVDNNPMKVWHGGDRDPLTAADVKACDGKTCVVGHYGPKVTSLRVGDEDSLGITDQDMQQ